MLDQLPSTSTGFSGTLFECIKDDPATGAKAGEYVISFRSTEFIDDAIRDSASTNTLEVHDTGVTPGDIALIRDGIDLTLRIKDTGDEIIIAGGDLPFGAITNFIPAVREIRFADGTVWSLGYSALPSGADKTVSIDEDTPYAFQAADFGFTDSSIDDALRAVRIDSLPNAGVLKFKGNPVGVGQLIAAAELGQLVFTPATNAHGANHADFRFTVQDQGRNFAPASNTLRFDVAAVNDAPVFVGGEGSGFVEATQGIGIALAVLPDGGVLVAGTVLARYNALGILDANFGQGGIVSDLPLGGAYGVFALDDGGFLVSGAMDHDFALFRYDANGKLDKNFGDGSKTPNDPWALDIGNKPVIAVQGDGKIVQAWGRDDYRSTFRLVRHCADGTLDASFGDGGRVTYDANSRYAGQKLTSILSLPDGKLIVAGIATDYDESGSWGNMVLQRFEANGAPDASFGIDGQITAGPTGYLDLATPVLLSDGRILIASAFNASLAIHCFDPDGTLDTSFGNNGQVSNYGLTFHPRAMLLQPDGKIVLAGESQDAMYNHELAVLRLNADGSLDKGFGNLGKVITSLGKRDSAYPMAMTLDAQGDILVTGWNAKNAHTEPSTVFVVRYDSNGLLDGSFGPAPELAGTVGNQGRFMSYTIPAHAFTDPDVGDHLSYQATWPDGSPLPEWLTFDPETLTFSGIPAANDVGSLVLKIMATDTSGLSTETTFEIRVTGDTEGGNNAPTGAVTINGLAEQKQTLSASHTLADADGLGEIAYQWQSSEDGTSWTNLAGGKGSQLPWSASRSASSPPTQTATARQNP